MPPTTDWLGVQTERGCDPLREALPLQTSPHPRACRISQFTEGRKAVSFEPDCSLAVRVRVCTCVRKLGWGTLEKGGSGCGSHNLDQSHDGTGGYTGTQPVTPTVHPQFSFSSRGEVSASSLLLVWLCPQVSKKSSLTWTPRKAVVKGGRWPASKRKVLGSRGTGQGVGWWHPCPDSSLGCGWTSASHLEKAASISPWVTDICKGGFLGVAGSRMVTLAQVVDPKQSFTGVQKPPSSLWVEPCPRLHSASPWKPRGAHRQLPATPAHRVPGVPTEAG